MTREQIERAAKETLVNEPVELQATKVGTFQRGFIAGSQWRINSAWHDASEKPNGNNKCLVELRIPGRNPTYKLWTWGWENSFVTRWAYMDDLIPERKEETNGGR